MDNLQEKFQITAPPNKNDDATEGWSTPNSQMMKSPQHMYGDLLNQLPTTGLEIPGEGDRFKLVMAGSNDVTDCVSPSSLRDGFVGHNMEGTDDQFTGEHVDLFYGEAVGENDAGKKVTGFVERNNYLDRS
jgi:hypothetical protein